MTMFFRFSASDLRIRKKPSTKNGRLTAPQRMQCPTGR